MADLSFKSIIASFLLLCIATCSGWVITHKIAGQPAANEFFVAFVSLVVTLLLAQLLLWSASRKRLLYQILYRATFPFTLMSFFLGFLFPIFWMPNVGQEVKISIVIFGIVVSLWNFWGGISDFREKWSLKGDKLLSKDCKIGFTAIAWGKMMIALGVAKYGQLIAGLGETSNGILSIILLASMLVGLNLRNVFPEFSMFAWGMPCAIGAAYAMFIFGSNLGELLKVREVEIARNIKFDPE